MNTHNDPSTTAMWICIGILLFLLGCSAFVGYHIGVSQMETLAVEQEAAHWNVDNSGDTTFKWNTPNE